MVAAGFALSRLLAQPLRLLVAIYRLVISPFLPAACRFYPSCSAYADEALAKHGLIRGGWLTARRLGRCHPFHPGGIDPVPPTRREATERAAHEADHPHAPHGAHEGEERACACP